MIGVIGGSGFYKLAGIENIEPVDVDTPFGKPSARIVRGALYGNPVAFLPRHGENHEWLPSEINYRANIFALKKIGVRKIIGVSAVGSLRAEIAPGSLCIPDQYIDFTKGRRPSTFFGNGLSVHISTSEPCCPALSEQLATIAKRSGTHPTGTLIHERKVYACVEGPRLGTRAESHFLRSAGADMVGMTNVPEVFLAREAQLCYSTIAIATDYDCWQDDPTEHASADKIMALYRANLSRIQSIILGILSEPKTELPCRCRESLKGAIVVSRTDIASQESQSLLKFLQE